MNELIKTSAAVIGGEEIQAVNARELWQFLESKQRFADWIKSRIAEYGFIDGSDYLIHKFMKQLPSGAKHCIDYIITMDMAKELAMVENNERGKQARQYFIEIEKRYRRDIHAVRSLSAKARFLETVYEKLAVDVNSVPAHVLQLVREIETPPVPPGAPKITRTREIRNRIAACPGIREFLGTFSEWTGKDSFVNAFYARYSQEICGIDRGKWWDAFRAIRPMEIRREPYCQYIRFR